MKTLKICLLLALFLGGGALSSFARVGSNSDMDLSAGFMLGYNRGLGTQFNLTLEHIDLTFDLRLAVGYSFLNPGNSVDARRIFISDATNGTPEKKGRSFDYRFDFMVPVDFLDLDEFFIFFGPRGSSFNGNFKYIGGNEDFDVKSNQWGAGGGAEVRFSFGYRLTLLVSAGFDYYIRSTLDGHDTAYSPDNDNVNPRPDNQNGGELFTYKEANKAIRQPRLMPFALLGVSYTF